MKALQEISPAAENIGSSGSSDGIEACLLEDELLEYQAGRCSEAQLVRLDVHLDGCASCRDLVHHLLRSEQADGDETRSGKGWLTTFTPGNLVASRYLIQRFVGKGGMGEVYEAFDRLMAMRVALKTVICTASDRPRAVHKLMDEVKNALRVGHPNVCRINELQEHRDPLNPSAAVPFFTMEFVDGERLGQRSKVAPLPLADARCIAHQLLDGLQAAHARGVLHLDLKSDNVMLRRSKSPPEVVIMDFGLSRALDRPSRQPSQERFELAGTLPYMSVEQLESRPALGPATDVYSFGVVLYEMLTGRLPFAASSTSALLLEQLRTRPPPPSRYAPRLSPALDRFVLRCLASEASQRFAHAGAALEALQAVGGWERRPARALAGWRLGALVAGCSLAGMVAFEGVGRHEVVAAPVLPSAPAASDAAATSAAASKAAPASAAPSLAAPSLAAPANRAESSATPASATASRGAPSSAARARAMPARGTPARAPAETSSATLLEKQSVASAPASKQRAHPVLPLVPPAPGLQGSELRRLAHAGEGRAGQRAGVEPSPGSSHPPERGAPPSAPREAAVASAADSALPRDIGTRARADAPARILLVGEETPDWTPRALPSSLLVPARRTR